MCLGESEVSYIPLKLYFIAWKSLTQIQTQLMLKAEFVIDFYVSILDFGKEIMDVCRDLGLPL